MGAKFCSDCGVVNDLTSKHCYKCGKNIINEPRCKSIIDTSYNDRVKNVKMHRRHFTKSITALSFVSAFIQLIVMYFVAQQHDWTLILHAITAVITIHVVAKLRMGVMANLLLTFTATFIILYFASNDNGPFSFIMCSFACWLLSFWYAIIGHHIKMNEDVHGSGGIQ
jgi:hypothetical protein